MFPFVLRRAIALAPIALLMACASSSEDAPGDVGGGSDDIVGATISQCEGDSQWSTNRFTSGHGSWVVAAANMSCKEAFYVLLASTRLQLTPAQQKEVPGWAPDNDVGWACHEIDFAKYGADAKCVPIDTHTGQPNTADKRAFKYNHGA
jgi:hypothetical protein